ncbi:MAG: lipase family protein [Myxococcota bacterium]|nr:lipase family protein [Myxococcota bacterium]
MRALSYGPTGLVFAMVLIGCGEPTSGTVFTPTEPEAVVEPEIEEPVEEVAEEDIVEDVVEPEPEPEAQPPMVWTAPVSEDLRCGNLEIPFTFDGLSTEYSLSNAFWSMWFAKRSFTGDTEETEAELRALGFTDYRYIHNEIAQLQVLIVANDETMFIAYQGSKEVMDWIANFYFLQRDGEEGVSGRVHQGFALALDSEWSEILTTVQSFSRAGQTIWTSGHSMGAALATITAARLVQEGFNVGPLYTHASPRVGNTTFAQELYSGLGGNHYRMAHGLDLIPHLPPAGESAEVAANFIPLGITGFGEPYLRDLGYTHAGSLYRMELDDTVTHFPGLQEDEDHYYWSQVGFGTILELLISQEQEALHHEDAYLCKLRTLWLASRDSP